MTQLLFCSICIVSLVVLAEASRQDNKFLLFIGIAILSITSGLRASDVGIDTSFYYDAFVSDFTLRSWQFEEEGFRAIVRFLMALFGSPEVVFLAIAIATNSLIILRLWDFRTTASFAYMSFFYIAVFYIGTMNVARQYLAVAIMFFATRLLEQKRYVLFVVVLMAATTIHTTALMGIVCPFVYLWWNIEKKKRIYLGIAAVVLIPAAFMLVVNYTSDHIENYFSNSIDNVNVTYVYRLVCFLLAILLIWMSDNNIRKQSRKSSYLHSRNPIPLFAFMGLLASSAGMFFEYLERIGYYFALFEAVFWGTAIRKKAWGWLYFLMPTVYALYVFGYELVFNGSGIFPFHFFFN